MKIAPYLLAATLAAPAAELPMGFVSANQTFAVRSGNSFVNSSLDAYEGRILVVMMMTPWCPDCLSNGAAVGDGILDHFNAPSRGGRNQHGIEVDSLLLSVEPAANWDANNASIASTNGYERWGLDANAQRQNPRVMLGYYRGGYPNGVNYTNLYSWGNDRRRVVVLNLVRNSASHVYGEVVINQNSFTSGDAATAQMLINAIKPAPVFATFAQWAGGHAFPAGTADADDDPDRDGCVNLLEFFHGTHPLQAASRDPGPSLVRDGAGLKLVYRRARNIGGFTLEHRTAAGLAGWQVVTPTAPPTMIALGDVDEITVSLAASVDPVRFYQLAVSLE